MLKNKIILPHNFSPRNYQIPIFNAIFKKNIKRIIQVWHRRAGKDITDWQVMIMSACLQPALYGYFFPELKQGRRNLWQAITSEGLKFLDYIPSDLILHEDNSLMKIKIQNSIIEIASSNRYDTARGANYRGVILSEFSESNPYIWDVIRPMLAENNGWAIINFTPKGGNHAYDLYYTNLNNPNWFTQLLTVNDTKRLDGSPVISQEFIKEELRSGMSQDMIDQEYYCSFEAAVVGAYFSHQLKAAYENNRIIDFAIDTSIPVYTFWDLGYGDSTAIWFLQPHGLNEWRAINYYENQGHMINHYINYLDEYKSKNFITYGGHFFPHDGNNNDLFSGNRLQRVQQLGLNVSIIPRCKAKIDAIEDARFIFNRVTFHKTYCKYGINCLKEYHKEYNSRMQRFENIPAHNWASDGADSFMTFAQWLRHYSQRTSNPIVYNVMRMN